MSTELTFEDFEVGQRFETGGRTATEADIRMFVGATGSTDRIHVDHDYAADHPLVDDVICHGTLTLAITDGLLADEIAQEAALSMNYTVGRTPLRDVAAPSRRRCTNRDVRQYTATTGSAIWVPSIRETRSRPPWR